LAHLLTHLFAALSPQFLGLSDGLGKDISSAIHSNESQDVVLAKLRHVVGAALRMLQYDPRLFACMNKAGESAASTSTVESGLTMEEVREMTRYLAQEARSTSGSSTEVLC
jgi:hypothetical protein